MFVDFPSPFSLVSLCPETHPSRSSHLLSFSNRSDTTFKYLGDLMGLKVLKTAAGTGANFALCEAVDKEELGMTLSVGFGQGTLNGGEFGASGNRK